MNSKSIAYSMIGSDRFACAEAAQIPSPQLVFNADQIRRNIAWMIEEAKGATNLWPHIKTHKSADVVRLMQAQGINRFKCATIAEAEMAASLGAKAVILAYTLIGPNIGRFLRLMDAYADTNFYALADSEEGLRQIEAAAGASKSPVNILVDLNLGQNRTGILPEQALPLIRRIAASDLFCFSGLHAYDGHVVDSDYDKRLAVVRDEHTRIAALIEALKAAGLPPGAVVYGGSTTFTSHTAAVDRFFSPGTITLHDFGYARRYPDLLCQPAAAILARVISHPGHGLFTLDAGSKAIASDPPIDVRGSIAGIGDAAESIFQNEEHWVWRMKRDADPLPDIGTVLYVVPGHICPTVALYAEAAVVSEGKLKGYWPITARDRTLTI